MNRMRELNKKNFFQTKNKKRRPEDFNTFEIGLVLGGAVSAGTYTAGVLDYLFEALEAWEAAKKKEAQLPLSQRKIPPHNVKINVIAGGSAGGMIAAMRRGHRSRSFRIERRGPGPLPR